MSIFGLTSQSVDFVYASAQPIDFLARTKNTSFPNRNLAGRGILIRGFRMDTIYSNRGMRAEALKVYEECKKALADQVGVGPCRLTVSIHEKIMENS